VAVHPAPKTSSDPALSTAEPTFALRASQPFYDLLASRGLLPGWLVESIMRSDPDDRIALKTALQMLDDAVAMTGDPELGLHAALRVALDAPLLEYVTSSCATIRESLETFARYVMLVNDALDVRLACDGERATLEFRCPVPMSRAAVDFGIASMHLARVRREPAHLARDAEEICFEHPEPESIELYRKVFGASRLRFGAPLNGVVFPAAWLDLPLDGADPRLHELLLRTVEDQMTDLSSRQRLTQRVRALLRDGIAQGDSTAERIADRLRISRRTLSRRLEQEGTSFKTLLDQTRCSLSLRYLLADRLTVTEIATRLGFSEPASFYKAFRRWFGTTPTQYLHRIALDFAPARRSSVDG
jgi:AraC-like DNA-binding protein